MVTRRPRVWPAPASRCRLLMARTRSLTSRATVKAYVDVVTVGHKAGGQHTLPQCRSHASEMPPACRLDAAAAASVVSRDTLGRPARCAPKRPANPSVMADLDRHRRRSAAALPCAAHAALAGAPRSARPRSAVVPYGSCPTSSGCCAGWPPIPPCPMGWRIRLLLLLAYLASPLDLGAGHPPSSATPTTPSSWPSPCAASPSGRSRTHSRDTGPAPRGSEPHSAPSRPPAQPAADPEPTGTA